MNVTQYLGINDFLTSIWPSVQTEKWLAAISNNVLEDLTKSLNLDQLGISAQYQDALSKNVSQYTAKGYILRALKSLDENLNKLSQKQV